MNKVILMGRLTKNPEVRYSAGGDKSAVAKFSIAVGRKYKKENDIVNADFFNCTAFGKLAEFVEKYLIQGTKIVLMGRIQNENYINKEGQKVYGNQIIAEEIDFAGSRKNPAPENEPVSSEEFISIPDDIDMQVPFK